MTKQSENTKSPQLIQSLAILAALLYNIWPLGYLLDHGALNNSYVSVLAAPHRPYNWLFILADVLTGSLALTVAVIIWNTTRLSKLVLLTYAAFGLATLLDAIVPIADKCSSSISACGVAPSQILSYHDLASLVAYFSLYASLLGSFRIARKNKSEKLSIYNWTFSIYYIWCLAGVFLALSVVIDNFTTISQTLFLAACGAGLIIVPKNLRNNVNPV